MPFVEDPVLKMLKSGEEWQLQAPLSYIHKSGLIITVPRGFITDLASIPRLFHSLIPVNGRHSPAAILHDYLYATQTVSRKQADGFFFDAMEDIGVNPIRRKAMYWAVRLGGWLAWEEREHDMHAFPETYRRQNGLP